MAGGSARIVGLTSRTGSFGYNLALSRRRADEVIAELRSQLGARPLVASDAGAGESLAWLAGVPDGIEHPSWRSVVVVYSNQPEPPPLPRLVPQPRPPSIVSRFVTKDVYEPTS